MPYLNVPVEKALTGLTEEDRQTAIQVLQELQDGDTTSFDQLIGSIYREPVPDIEEFTYGQHYLAREGKIRPRIMDIIVAIDDPTIRQVFLCAGRGVGKTEIVVVSQARAVNKIISMWDPFTYFDIGDGSQIAAINMSVSATQAEKVMFSRFKKYVTASPWFQQYITNVKAREMEFGYDVIALSGHSEYEPYLGYDVFFGSIDEASHFDETPHRHAAQEIEEGILGSCNTRFPNDYKLLGISSPKHDEDYLYSRVQGIKTSGTSVRVFRGDSDSDTQAVPV